MDRVELLNTYVDNLTMQETVDEVEKYIINEKPLHLMGLNADKINELNVNEHLRDIVNGCEIINADGASVVWASKVLKCPLKERVAGIDLMQELLKVSEEKGYKVYFLGAKPDVVKEMVSRFETAYPKLQVAGFRDGYFSKEEWERVKDTIDKSKAQLVFVGISSPLKEYLVEYFQQCGSQAVYMGVGGSFDVLSGQIPRAPKILQKCGLEWMFRMIQEPKRLLKRYMEGNFQFIVKVFRTKFRKVRNQ